MMSRGLHIFTWSDTRTFIHPTFLLVPFVFILPSFLRGDAETALLYCRIMVMSYLMVILHEYGHVFMAKARGIETGDITLHLFGGIAWINVDRIGNRDEIMVALAGPAVNLFFMTGSFSLLAILKMTGLSGILAQQLLFEFLLVNAVLLGFNMLPIFPMDGGRVLRGCLAEFLDGYRSTVIAVFFGLMCAACVAIFAVSVSRYIIFLPIAFVVLASFLELRNFPKEYNSMKRRDNFGKVGM